MRVKGLEALLERSNRILYRSFAAIIIIGFATALFSIAYGGSILLTRAAGSPIAFLELHFELLASLALPALVIGVSMILTPAYSGVTQMGIYSISIAFLIALSAISRIYIYVSPNDPLEILSTASLAIASWLNLFSSLQCFLTPSRRPSTRFFKAMNIFFVISLSAMAIFATTYALQGIWVLFDPRLYYVFPIPIIFSVMIRTDPFTRRYYSKDLDTLLWIPPTLSIASAIASMLYISSGDRYVAIAADTLVMAGIFVSSLVIFGKNGKSSRAGNVGAYANSLRIAHLWGITFSLILMLSHAGLVRAPNDLYIHMLMLGFVGNVFVAYSRFLIPLKPFAIVLPRILDNRFIAFLNLMIILRVLSSIDLPGASQPIIYMLAGVMAIAIILYIIYKLVSGLER
ncbi:MAG: hypothetical protein QXW41_09480 [Fervidicoccaceae archaeon]